MFRRLRLLLSSGRILGPCRNYLTYNDMVRDSELLFKHVALYNAEWHIGPDHG